MKYTIRRTIEVEVDVDVDITPGELRTHNEPGCPQTCEKDGHRLVPGTIEAACKYFDTDEFFQECFEHADNEWETARDEAADNKRKGLIEDG